MKFTASKFELELISKIVDRAITMAKEMNFTYPKMDAMMDIEAVHSNDTALNLQALLDADNFNFAHDVFGIYRHIDRKTGKLQDCFSPRFSIK